MTLRRKILNRVKPKLLNNKKLNGAMMAGLITAYVDSINNGVVPNIESAWTYICQSECQKALENAVKEFEFEFKENFEMKAPMFEDELKELYKESKKEALKKFNSSSLGEMQEEFLRDVKEKFKQIYEQFSAENKRQASLKSQGFL